MLYVVMLNYNMYGCIVENYRVKSKIQAATQLIDDYTQSAKKTWAELQESDKRADHIECSFCLQEFEEPESVVQLDCHKNHVYH